MNSHAKHLAGVNLFADRMEGLGYTPVAISAADGSSLRPGEFSIQVNANAARIGGLLPHDIRACVATADDKGLRVFIKVYAVSKRFSSIDRCLGFAIEATRDDIVYLQVVDYPGSLGLRSKSPYVHQLLADAYDRDDGGLSMVITANEFFSDQWLAMIGRRAFLSE